MNAIENIIYEDDDQLVEDIAKALELIYGDAVAYDNNDAIIGYKRELLERELNGNSFYEGIITEMEEQDLLISENDIRIKQNSITPYLAACEWLGKKRSDAFYKAENKCIVDGLKSNYSLTAIASGLANAIANKQFTKAAKMILKAGIKGNIAGVIVVLGSISLSCTRKMEKLFPGDSNCV